jgi:chromosomal replication initiator protein
VNPKHEYVSAQLHTELRAAVDEATYRLWLEPLHVKDYSPGNLLVSAPAPIAAWVEERFGALLTRCVRHAIDPDASVTFVAHPLRPERTNDARPGTRSPHASSHFSTGAGDAPTVLSHLRPNPRLTFDRFIIGACNRLAHGAALTIAEAPGQGFNPLFICGPPGVGKTHLLHSVSAFLQTHNPGTVVCLTSSESFTNDFLAALQSNCIGTFKARVRHVDVLLVDDIQFLERKTRTEEEFFHTFNALYEVGSQIVVTSDRPPRDMRELETRLRERFEAGLLADIHPPDVTTRAAILHKQIRDQGIQLADPAVIWLLAERVTSSVRALEGALTRIVAFASLTGRAVSLELAQEVLESLYPRDHTHQVPTTNAIAQIQDAACKHFGLSRGDLLSSGRARNLAWPRQIAMYLARELTSESLPAIGRQFGGRDHTTVLYACRRAQDRLAHDPAARDTLNSLCTALSTDLAVPHRSATPSSHAHTIHSHHTSDA